MGGKIHYCERSGEPRRPGLTWYGPGLSIGAVWLPKRDVGAVTQFHCGPNAGSQGAGVPPDATPNTDGGWQPLYYGRYGADLSRVSHGILYVWYLGQRHWGHTVCAIQCLSEVSLALTWIAQGTEGLTCVYQAAVSYGLRDRTEGGFSTCRDEDVQIHCGPNAGFQGVGVPPDASPCTDGGKNPLLRAIWRAP